MRLEIKWSAEHYSNDFITSHLRLEESLSSISSQQTLSIHIWSFTLRCFLLSVRFLISPFVWFSSLNPMFPLQRLQSELEIMRMRLSRGCDLFTDWDIIVFYLNLEIVVWSSHKSQQDENQVSQFLLIRYSFFNFRSSLLALFSLPSCPALPSPVCCV